MRHCKALLVLLLASLPVRAAAEGAASSHGALSSATTMRFAIAIPRMLRMRLIDHPSTVVVTAADIARGEIVVRGAQVDIAANNRNGFLVRAQLRGQEFTGMHLSGLARDFRADGEASSITPMPSTGGGPRPEPRDVEYRLRLAANALPGRYAWPVALTIQDP